jgi:hypothetical protein
MIDDMHSSPASPRELGLVRFSPRGLLGTVRRDWPKICSIAVIAGMVVGLLSTLRPPVYEATARAVFAEPPSADVAQILDVPAAPDAWAAWLAQYVRSADVAAALAERAEDVGRIQERLIVEARPDQRTLVVRAQADSASGAAGLATAGLEAAQQRLRDVLSQVRDAANNRGRDETAEKLRRDRDEIAEKRRRIELNRQQVRSQLAIVSRPAAGMSRYEAASLALRRADLESRLAELAYDEELVSSAAAQIRDGHPATGTPDAFQLRTAAAAPSRPIKPRPLRDGLATAAVTLLLGLAYSWWKSATRPVLGVADRDTEELIGVALIGHVGQVADHDGDAVLASAIDARLRVARASTLILVSVDMSAPSALVARRLADLGAAAGQRILVIDIDFEGRALSRSSGLDTAPGVAEALAGTERPPASLSTDGLWHLLPAGRGGTNAALRSPRLGEMIRELASRYDLTLVAGSSLAKAPELLTAAAGTDAIVLVAAEGTLAETASESAARLRWAGLSVLGLILGPATVAEADDADRIHV